MRRLGAQPVQQGVGIDVGRGGAFLLRTCVQRGKPPLGHRKPQRIRHLGSRIGPLARSHRLGKLARGIAERQGQKLPRNRANLPVAFRLCRLNHVVPHFLFVGIECRALW